MEEKGKKKGRYRYLAGNIALFSVSNFVSKILVFLLVPLYTDVLSTYEYGIADIMQVTLLLLVPALTFNMGEAALRFGIEHADKRGSILRSGISYVLRADAIVTGLCIMAFAFAGKDMKQYILMFAILFIANCMYEFLVLFFQGCEAVPVVVLGSISSTALMIACNIFFLLIIKTGLSGYIFSQIIAYALASCIMMIAGMRKKVFTKPVEDEELKKEMLAYGVPLIAYSTGSWVNNAADRYIVLALCGAAVNGVYGVAYKIPAILMVLQRIFAQAWQMSATKSYRDEKSSEFFTEMYRTYNCVMVIGCAFLILFVDPISRFMFRKDFYAARLYVPALLISVIFGALTGFLGSICLAFKDSKSMGVATSSGAVVNVALNFALIPYFGAMGAAVATAVSYCLMCFLAYRFVKKYTKIDNNPVKDTLAYLILVALAIAMTGDVPAKYPIGAILTVVLALLYYTDLVNITTKLLSIVKRRNDD